MTVRCFTAYRPVFLYYPNKKTWEKNKMLQKCYKCFKKGLKNVKNMLEWSLLKKKG